MNFRAPSRSRTAQVDDAEVAASVGLGMLPGIGPRTIRRWMEEAGSAGAVWRQLPDLVRGRVRAAEIVAAWRTLSPDAVVRAARRRGMAVIPLLDTGYPERLRAIPDPPAALFVRGRIEDGPAVAVVGARRATPYGRAAAGRIAADLAAVGVCVVSGLARGIDGVAHQAALEAGGTTVAVLGCGADVIYPREHRRLAESIARCGGVVSEFAPGMPPLPGHFPRRNRLISGLAQGVVVVEGTENSGALVTVDYALDQGREVFAVPGSIFSVKSRAPHRLLRQGAAIAESAADILAELGWSAASPSEPSSRERNDPGSGGAASADERSLLALLDEGPHSMDGLIDDSGLPAGRVAAIVTGLELRGLIQTLPGQVVMRAPRKT